MTDALTRRVIRTDGTVIPLERPHSIAQIEDLIFADVLDTVNLRNGMVMLVNDLGHPLQLPVNQEATRLYHSVCIPGTTHIIRGDVVIVPDADFGSPL